MAYSAFISMTPCPDCGGNKRYKHSHKCVSCVRIQASAKNASIGRPVEDKTPRPKACEHVSMRNVKYTDINEGARL